MVLIWIREDASASFFDALFGVYEKGKTINGLCGEYAGGQKMAEEINVTGQSTETKAQEPQGYDLAEVVAAVGVEAILDDPTVKAEMLSRRDRSVTQALNTARTKWEAEAKAKADEMADEATRLANMTAAEKERYQFQKEKEAFEAQKHEFEHKNLVLETSKQMLGAGLPDLADYVTGKDATETANNIAKVTEIIGAWKAEQLNAAMRGTTPKDMTPSKTYSREDLKGMTAEQINKLWDAGALKNLK